MRVGVDLDGVTLEFQQRWIDLYVDYFDRFVPYEAYRQWDALLERTHFSDIEEFYVWFTQAGGWREMPWIPGSRGGIDALGVAGHDVVFVTNRPECAEPDTISQLHDFWWPRPFSPEISFVDDKTEANCDVYIDDAPHVIDKLSAARKAVVVFDQPWNLASVGPLTPNRCRARDWHEVVRIVNHYSKTGFLNLPVKETA